MQPGEYIVFYAQNVPNLGAKKPHPPIVGYAAIFDLSFLVNVLKNVLKLGMPRSQQSFSKNGGRYSRFDVFV